MDPDANDQFSIISSRGNAVQIMQNTALEPTKLEERGVSKCFLSCIDTLNSIIIGDFCFKGLPSLRLTI